LHRVCRLNQKFELYREYRESNVSYVYIRMNSDAILHHSYCRKIFYAGGNNRLSTDLSIPKALLPIGNHPLIWYTLEIIQSHQDNLDKFLMIIYQH
jgi:2-C-methyl-D-erythritol 4-phosphate cytidylyltransferase